MAGRGPAPKSPEQRRRRNAPAKMETIMADGKKHGSELPDSHEWPQATLAWWDTWRSCAMASKFTDTDWSFLLDTAILHANFWLGDKTVAAELRLRVAKFGATPEDRARLKIEIGDPNSPPAVTGLQPKAATDRRTRLLRAVGNDDGQS